MNKWWYPVILAVLVGILFSGIILLIASAPRGVPIVLSNLSTPAKIRFEIYGAIRQPGVYSAPANIRVEDAVAYAGGFTESADISASHLAAAVSDSDQILIPTRALYEATITPMIKNSTGEKINLNTADIEELQSLPGIGEKKAKDIIHFRETNGGFSDVADLLDIPGFGEKTVDQFLDLITIE